MFAAIAHAVRALFAPAVSGSNASWTNRFLPTELKDIQSERDCARFNTARDFCW